jgi:FMN-dependent NADH-azoreductase
MSAPYIKNLLNGLFGIEIVEEVVIEGHNAFPDKSEEIIRKGLEEVKAVALRLAKSN